MDGNQDESDASRSVKDGAQGLRAPALEQDKKSAFWMSGVMGCFSTVISLFTRADLKPTNDDDWEVPFESLTNLAYLGSGAQGVVTSGILRGEMVAVKRLRDRSETNIKHLRKLNHENIVRFRGVCTMDPYCIIMEYCQYGPLFEYLQSVVCFEPKQTMKWAKDIALGMAYLHSHKIIHRDLKSPNILIADNLVVKVSDFGTSREWNDVSATMSFTGTVAWMAPEVIRHEPCCERVDVWSYGVVLWELLTREVPYKNLETHAIMWGVGTDIIALPVPTMWPKCLKELFFQCWNRMPRNRPSFKIIAANIELMGAEFTPDQLESLNPIQGPGRQEVKDAVDHFYVREETPAEQETNLERREEIKHARDLRHVYEQQMLRANDMYMAVCTVKMQVDQRERAVAEREKALKYCRCSQRKPLKYLQRQTSSSSDGVRTHERRRKRKSATPARLVVNYVDKPHAATVTVAVTNDKKLPHVCTEETDNNNTVVVEKKNTVVEQNGNINVVKQIVVCDNFKADVAQV